MNFVPGKSLPLPCRHGRAVAPPEAGEHPRKCRTCGETHVLVVEYTNHLTAVLGHEVLHAKWLQREQLVSVGAPTHEVGSVAHTNGGRTAGNESDLLSHHRRVPRE